jgi:Beta-galactosidase
VRCLNPLVIADSDDRNWYLSCNSCEKRSEATKNPTNPLTRFFAITLTTFILCLTASAQQPTLPSFFGLQMNSGTVTQQPWPSVSFRSTRLWDGAVHWADINPSNGVYDWTLLDRWLDDAQANNVRILYTFGEVPTWASSKPNDTSCAANPGSCDPPRDLNADGSGTDQVWKDFVSALVTHNKNSTTGHITKWELWNEALGNTRRWTGTIPQLIRMAQDATAIIKAANPTAGILTPSFGPQSRPSRALLESYLAAGGGNYADEIALHGYVATRGKANQPEDLVRYMGLLRVILAKYGQNNKPLWDTEASWGSTENNGFTDPDMQAAFLARFYLLHRSLGFARFYWYQWNNNNSGALWIPDPHDPSLPGTVLKPGIAYAQMYDWMVGAKLTSACTANGTVWTCGLSRDGGYQAEAIWDTAESCKHGKCDTTEYTVDSKYTQYRTLDGKTTPVTDARVPIGAKPILVEN